MKYYVKWDDLGKTKQEGFDNISDARCKAKEWSRSFWFGGETWITDATSNVIEHYVRGIKIE